MAVTLVLLAGLSQPASAAKKPRPKPRSLTASTNLADPGVVRAGGRFIAVATGAGVPRATSRNGTTWTTGSTALLRKPAWAKVGETWASDLIKIGNRWVLYFAAPVRGLKPSSHCIGVATASRPTRSFTPVGDRPLVCPPNAQVPAAEDQFVDPVAPSPTPTPTPEPNPPGSHGAIDPSVSIINGRPYLYYKTDGRPSSIRLLALTADGLHASGRSRQVLTSSGVIENPVLVRHGRFWILFTSEGDYSRCSYRTVYRRALTPFGSWQAATPHVFLSSDRQRLCGPGGADVVRTSSRTLLYFHGWTCRNTRKPCANGLHAYQGRHASRLPVRSLYGLELGFTKGGFPKVKGWLKPVTKR